MEEKIIKLPFYLKLACVLFSLIALSYIMIVGKEILSPLIFSCIFSILLLPLASFFERKLKFPRAVAAIVAVILFLTVIISVLYVLGNQLSDLINDWPQFQKQLTVSINSIQDWITNTFHINARKQLDFIHGLTTKMLDSGTAIATTTLLSLSSTLLFFVFTFIYTFFFLLYRRLIKRFFIRVFREENATLVHDIIEQVQFMIRQYIIGIFFQLTIVSIVVCLAFWILGIKYAILLGLITGIFNIVPYLGIFTALVISTLITFATSGALGTVMIVAIIIVAMHLVDSNILLPLIVGSKVKINALITVLGVVVGELIWGIPGMFLSIPIIAVIKIIFERVDSFNAWAIILGDEEKEDV
ncbi:AI-2E family transporter [Pedobacter arcticus]|uniref:AI-2E family transporter n=1 Tax=Pedobacter arcticus TaxID=752140 RepID=UPI000378A221|nr:AI-2E family transporter [Pedobacter arcticus]